MQYTLQLYTLRKSVSKSLPKTLEQITAMGYSGIESYRLEPTAGNRLALQHAAKRHGLLHVSAMAPFYDLLKHSDVYTGFYNATGCAVAVVAMPPQEVLWGTAEKWRWFCTQMNHLGKVYAEHGIRLCYHHHHFEFARLGGDRHIVPSPASLPKPLSGLSSNQSGALRPIDILLDGLDDHIGLVCDTYRAQQGGASPKSFIQSLSGRLSGLHLRDYTVKRSGLSWHAADCPIGDGSLDIPGILEAARASGAQYAAVEQGSRNPLHDAERSMRYIRSFTEAQHEQQSRA